MIIYLVTSIIIESKQKLEQQALEDVSSAVYVVFKSPLGFLSDMAVIDEVLRRAIEIE